MFWKVTTRLFRNLAEDPMTSQSANLQINKKSMKANKIFTRLVSREFTDKLEEKKKITVIFFHDEMRGDETRTRQSGGG